MKTVTKEEADKVYDWIKKSARQYSNYIESSAKIYKGLYLGFRYYTNDEVWEVFIRLGRKDLILMNNPTLADIHQLLRLLRDNS